MALREELIRLVVGDFGMTHEFTLTNRRTGIAIDLTGVVTALLKLRLAGSTDVLESLSLDIQTPLNEGRLRLTWPAGATDHDPGRYEGEVELTGASSVQTPYQMVQFILREDF